MTQTPNLLAQSLTLRCGAVIPNRLAKSALSEALGTPDNHPTEKLVRLYEQWNAGGVGLCITGNVMISRRALGEPNNVVIEDEQDLPMLQKWASAATAYGKHAWVQLNHLGKQSPKGLNIETVSPSAVPFKADMQLMFGTPRALEDAEIWEIIARFGKSAGIVKKAGFSGVQIHGAHGYLVSQFLSPKANIRTDQWGGSPENRQRFVREVLKAMRAEVGANFPIGIKLNSADFQRGGFTEEEALSTIQNLVNDGIDLIEISGGTYEAPAMSKGVRDSTRAREAYFMDFAEKAKQTLANSGVPLLLTGGFRSFVGMNEALASGAIDMVGLGRGLAVEPDLPKRVLAGENPRHAVKPIITGIKKIDGFGVMEIYWYTQQLHRMGKGLPPRPNRSPLLSFFQYFCENGVNTFKSKRMRAKE